MAQIPVPRSYSEILGDMVDAFLSRYGLRALKVGSPVLSMLESAAQSDLRSSEDIFELLDSASLDQAEGTALDRIGADERVPRLTESAASGVVAIIDASFAKVSTKVFQGLAAPIVGTLALNVADASAFPTTGSVYVGRGTSDYEGPLAYTSLTNHGTYWTINLSSGTLRFHNTGEPVVLAQGGTRTVAAGTAVQTPQGNVVDAVQFKLLYTVQIPDGETEVDNVAVVAVKAGVGGNVTAGSISSFANSTPFDGATVTNALPYTNGQASETDDSYRDRIRQARQSRVRGTALALQTFSVGVEATDENKRVLSASVVSLQGSPTVLYIDDGTGYEERSSGIAVESFTDLALGGEYAFKTSQVPLAKAFLQSTEVTPFSLAGGEQLAFTVGGVTTVHTFNSDEFRSIANATAYEVVASINADPLLNWSARTVNNGTQVAVFAKADTDESIQNSPVVNGVDANAFLGFPSRRADTMRLYKNDRLLEKDGSIATITSAPIGLWSTFGSSEDLQLQVDGTPMANLSGGTYTFTSADFIAAQTGFTTLAANTPGAWAKVFNYRIPGITATVVNGLITIVSNRQARSTASLAVLGGSLVTKGMFAVTSVEGADSDYTLNRNTGELRLTSPLAAGDKLAAGSVNTRAFLQSSQFSTITVGGAGGHLFFVVDGDAQIIPHGLTAATSNTWSSTTEAGWSGVRQRMTSATTHVFDGVEVGDWIIFWDPVSPSDMLDRSFRVAAVDTAAGAWVEFDKATATAASSPFFFTSGGISFARTSALVELVTIPAAANYTAASLSALLTVLGASASVYQTQSVRLRTDTFSDANGDVALVAADTEGARFGLPVASATKNLTGHLASVESGNSELGTPDFHELTTNATASANPIATTYTSGAFFTAPNTADQMVWLRPHPDGKTLALTRYGQSRGYATPMLAAASGGGSVYNLTLQNLPTGGWTKLDRAYLATSYRLTSSDQLTVLVDEDDAQKRFVVPAWRTLKPVGATYGTTNTFKDADNGNQSLAVAFGAPVGFDFTNFSVWMAARVQTHLQGDSAHYAVAPTDLTRTILWRYFRLGPDGNQARLRYLLPSVPNAAVSWSIDNLTNVTNDVTISLASGALKTGYALSSNHNLGLVVTALAGGVSTANIMLGLATSSAQRDGAGNVTITCNLSASAATDHNLLVGYGVYVKNNNGAYPDGQYVITSRTATTFTYHDGGVLAGPTSITGTVSYGPSEATLSGASPAVVVGDILSINMGSSINTDGLGYRIDALPDNQTMTVKSVAGVSPVSVVQWAPLNNLSNFAIFANASQTASTIAAAVNALAGAPVAGTIIGSGAGVIDKSSYAEAISTANQWFSLADGVNHVRATTVPGSVLGDYQLTFKDATTATLSTNSDWANEVVRVVPCTAQNVVGWLNEPAVSGLFSVAEVSISSNAHKVQVASFTPGSAGSVQVQGGTANSATAALLGSASISASVYAVVTIRGADAAGLMATGFVSVDNATTLPKSVFNSGTVLNSIVASGPNWLLTFAGGTNVYTTSSGSTASALVAVEKQGKFLVIHDTGLATNKIASGTASEGDWVRITLPATTTYVGVGGNEAVSYISTGNLGIYRVVRVVRNPDQFGFGGTIWVENPAGVDQALAECDVFFYTPDSVMPGDTLHVSTPLWDGTGSNQGVFTVVDVGNAGSGSFLNQQKLTVAGTLSPVGSPAPALGTSLPQVQVIEGAPARYIKHVLSVAPNPLDATLYDVKFTTNPGYTKMGAVAGSVLTALDKLGFPTDLANGVDGYQYQTGLLAEVNKVVYGDPTDSATYPGVAAAGATVNIQGPLTKRVQVTISLRVKTGASRQDIEDRVKSAVAAVVNAAGVGEAISLSDIVDAAAAVGGVVSVVMVDPLATAGNDLINVQPYEKPLVLNVDEDVTVTFVGE